MSAESRDNSQKVSILVLSLVVIITLGLISYSMYAGFRWNNEYFQTNSLDLLNTISIMIVGGFLTLAKELFKKDNSITIADIMAMKKEGVI